MRLVISILLSASFLEVLAGAPGKGLYGKKYAPVTPATYENHGNERMTVQQVSNKPNQSLVLSSGKRKASMRGTVHERLEQLFKSLRGYVFETVFDASAFEKRGNEFQAELFNIIKSVQQNRPPDRATSKKVKFVTYVFRIMATSVELLKFYEYLGTSESHLLCAVVDLKVRSFSFYNSAGGPDFHNEGLAVNVDSYLQYLKLLRKEFAAFNRVPFGTRHMFYKQYTQTRMILQQLAKHLPKKNSI